MGGRTSERGESGRPGNVAGTMGEKVQKSTLRSRGASRRQAAIGRMWLRRTATIKTLALVVLIGISGCGLLFPESPLPVVPPSGEGTPITSPSSPPSLPAEELPIGLGTLRQEEISIALRRDEVEMQITPLDESVIRLTAPDTYERLASLSRGLQEIFLEETGSAVPFQLFLVSLYSEMTETTFEPNDLTLMNRGIRHRPVQIRPLSPEWDSHILRPRLPLLAVYAFPGEIDLGRDVEVEYREVRSFEWDRIFPLIEAERSRLRGRTP